MVDALEPILSVIPIAATIIASSAALGYRMGRETRLVLWNPGGFSRIQDQGSWVYYRENG